MDFNAVKRLSTGFVPIALLSVLLLVSLYLMGAATQNTAQFGRLYFVLLAINILGLIALVVLIGTNFVRLARQYRSKAVGSRLTVRLVVLFSVLALVPVSVLYYFSLQFIHRGIDSWLDVRIETALDDALELSRASLASRQRELLRQTRGMVSRLQDSSPDQFSSQLQRLRVIYDAEEISLLTRAGQVVAADVAEDVVALHMPDQRLYSRVTAETGYIGLDHLTENALYVRVLVDSQIQAPSPVQESNLAQDFDQVPGQDSGRDSYLLHVLFPVSDRIGVLAGNVQATYAEYKQVLLLREPLKFSFTLTLSLVLLLSLLSAIWAAFFAARRLVAPIRVLAIGTRAVAGGDYSKRLPQHSHDELGFLVRSFNDMTDRIAEASAEALHSNQQLERERAYLRVVLGRLSSGVLTTDRHGAVRTANVVVGQILSVEPRQMIGYSLRELASRFTWLAELVNGMSPHLDEGGHEWREEFSLSGPQGQKIIVCAGTALPGGEGRHGHVIVFEDVTALVQAQRDAAWGEVARRLAHEIKNPLTPIQLSAERLRHKYLAKMDAGDADMLDRLTHTIIQQVKSMKEMVDAFSEYAHVPQLHLTPLQLNTVVREVLDMYRSGHAEVRISSQLDKELPLMAADAGRLRQLLHNLIKNALEAIEQGDRSQGTISLETRLLVERGCRFIELTVRDDGPGIPQQILEKLFDPYVTVKHKGSGLGLAIVKKIVEEHGGVVRAANNAERGASISITFPVERGDVEGVMDIYQDDGQGDRQ